MVTDDPMKPISRRSFLKLAAATGMSAVAWRLFAVESFVETP